MFRFLLTSGKPGWKNPVLLINFFMRIGHLDLIIFERILENDKKTPLLEVLFPVFVDFRKTGSNTSCFFKCLLCVFASQAYLVYRFWKSVEKWRKNPTFRASFSEFVDFRKTGLKISGFSKYVICAHLQAKHIWFKVFENPLRNDEINYLRLLCWFNSEFVPPTCESEIGL